MKSSFGTLARANPTAKDIGAGDVSAAVANLHGDMFGSKVRGHLVQEGLEGIAKGAAKKAKMGAMGPLAGPAIIADTLNDVKGIYSSYLEGSTGKNLESHLGVMRDQGALASGYKDLGGADYGKVVMPSDGTIPTLEQRDPVNPIMQEVGNRLTQAKQSFNPLKGDWGISELLHGR